MTLNWRDAYGVILVLVALLLLAATARAESLFETYSQKGRGELSAETREMGQSLRQTFSAEGVSHQQMTIDFAEYRSNLRKALLYGTRLATYSEYESDLEFARDKEIFQGLPEVQEPGDDEETQSKQEFMRKKYERMQRNVGDEVGTYVDLLQLSLDACESLTRHDISGVLSDAVSRETMREFLHDDTYRAFQLRQAELAGRWPEIARRIEAQVAQWQAPVAGPNDPIIAPQIVRALQ